MKIEKKQSWDFQQERGYTITYRTNSQQLLTEREREAISPHGKRPTKREINADSAVAASAVASILEGPFFLSQDPQASCKLCEL